MLKVERQGEINFHQVDCMEFMAGLPDKAYDLAIVDPPYGIGNDSLHSNRAFTGAGKLANRILNTGNTKWDIAPSIDYFKQLFRISKNQIIWGANYFNLPTYRCPIIWDKCQPWVNFSQVEIAWTSFNEPAKLFKFDNRTGDKIHPTQKPVALYRWLLHNYAKPGDKIFDSHGGSMSIAIACDMEGHSLDVCEIDEDYFTAAIKRFKQYKSKIKLFK